MSSVYFPNVCQSSITKLHDKNKEFNSVVISPVMFFYVFVRHSGLVMHSIRTLHSYF